MSSHVSSTISVRLEHIKHEITIVKEEIEIKCENEDNSCSFVEYNPLNEFNEGNIQFPASVKEEREDSSAHEDATVGHVNEGAHSDVKVKVEHQMEDEPNIEFSEIDIVDDPLAVVKEEPTSVSETPQDGSTNPRPLNIHMQVHSKKKLYTCDICKKGFDRRNNLHRHMRVHTGEKPYECEVCKKKFTEKNKLIPHMRVHSGERPYVCEVCKKKFTSNSNLTTHMRIHSDEKRYVCQICNKNFNHNYSLQVHLRFIHSSNRPYECEICKKSFTLNSTLTRHMAIHSNETPYECQICKTKFTTKCGVTKHVKNMHERF